MSRLAPFQRELATERDRLENEYHTFRQQADGKHRQTVYRLEQEVEAINADTALIEQLSVQDIHRVEHRAQYAVNTLSALNESLVAQRQQRSLEFDDLADALQQSMLAIRQEGAGERQLTEFRNKVNEFNEFKQSYYLAGLQLQERQRAAEAMIRQQRIQSEVQRLCAQNQAMARLKAEANAQLRARDERIRTDCCKFRVLEFHIQN